ncbi:hypothetical protein M3231_11935 [Neobacillus mesonae]|nr:hypothetical protein [Neobacillus mesonae]
MMKLNEAQLHLVSSLYNDKIPEMSEFVNLLESDNPKDRNAEMGYYMKELEKDGYIRTDKGTFNEGGREHPKYGNRVVTIWFDRIKLLPKVIRGLQNDEL